MLAEQRQAIANRIRDALATLSDHVPAIELQRPNVAAHGDLSCTVALQLAKPLGRPPRAIAEEIAARLRADAGAAEWLAAVEVAGPGFINLRLTDASKRQVVGEVLRRGAAFGDCGEGVGKTVLLEFVSANPTGPLHVGHGRQGALGDTIAALLATQGWAVTREFYYNDAGAQIQNLAVSVQARARGLAPGHAQWPEASSEIRAISRRP